MSGTEWFVSLFGLFLGYWIISRLIGGSPPTRTPPPQDGAPECGAEAGAEPWHLTLGIAPDATPDQIRSAYRSLMPQYHPDKVAHLGQELQDLAQRKSTQINLAYQQALRLRGERS